MMQYIRTEIAQELELYEKGLVPSTAGSAGIDLYVAEERAITLHHSVPTIIRTGLHLWTNDSSLITILAPRSSSDFRLTNTLGFIDSDYQGELMIKAIAQSEDRLITFQPGDKFAQMFIMPVISPMQIAAIEVDNFSMTTDRGAGGFGSTGSR